jgi:hypothetical protein
MIVSAPTNLGGWFTTALNVAGSFVGDPALGSQVAMTARPGYAAINQTPQQIADTVAPKVLSALKNPPSQNKLDPAYQALATSIAPNVAYDLAAAGYVFPPGSLGAEYQKPSPFNVFGGQNAPYAMIGAGILGLWGLSKLFRG